MIPDPNLDILKIKRYDLILGQMVSRSIRIILQAVETMKEKIIRHRCLQLHTSTFSRGRGIPRESINSWGRGFLQRDHRKRSMLSDSAIFAGSFVSLLTTFSLTKQSSYLQPHKDGKLKTPTYTFILIVTD